MNLLNKIKGNKAYFNGEKDFTLFNKKEGQAFRKENIIMT